MESTAVLAFFSPAFQHNDNIPERFTCEGKNIIPPLEVKNISKALEPGSYHERYGRACWYFDHWLYGIYYLMHQLKPAVIREFQN